MAFLNTLIMQSVLKLLSSQYPTKLLWAANLLINKQPLASGKQLETMKTKMFK